MSDHRSVHGIADDGATVRVEVDAGHDAGWLADAWPPLGLVRSDDPPAGATPSLVLGPAGPADLLRAESDLALFAAEHLAGPIPVHAAVVVFDDRAIVLPGRSHAGKTTLALALAELGGRIASDEYALIDPRSGLVTGWPRPLHVRVDGGVERRPGVVPGPAVLAGLVADLRFVPRGELDLADAHPADGALALLDNTVCAQRRPADSLQATAALARGARCLTGVRGEAADAALALVDQLRSGQAVNT